ncbi:AmmeMemoRadiSam system protein A [Malonomonas rubra]|uniref:AmmeMemoRadiSam system protein A n=1 Tax=Malonomonas rubra TaxID=57040 RepID=UPI0026EC1908|nr:AmmeMemoRadiSam system protein A [Malonomonas rubra]
MLSEKDASTLLAIARDAIISIVEKRDHLPLPREEKALNERSGCFVTLKQNDKLRGCIGNFQSERPLYMEVAEMAVASATKDPRFPPMEKAELDNFSLELSILSPLEKIDDVEQIEVGTHGIYLEKNFSRGVLLPQVAAQYGWDRVTFLQQTCQKAGLMPDAWQETDADIYIFSAQIIKEQN